MRARVSSKGQLVLPAEVRHRRGIEAGSEVEIEEVPGGVLLRLVRGPIAASLDDLLGCTGYTGPKKTLQDMEEAIRQGARARR
jgi:AbrB family looped-hinge helix DNA binding protein